MSRQKSHQTKGFSQRQLRVGEMIRHAVAELLARGEVHDDVLASHVVTIPEVRMSPDLRLATVYVMPLGGKDTGEVLAALDRNKRFIRGEITRAVNLKFAPDVRFMADETFDEAQRIEDILRSPQRRSEIIQEARIGMELDHPNLVKTLGIEELGEQLIQVLLYVEAGNLAQWYRTERPAPERRALGRRAPPSRGRGSSRG